MDDKYETNGQNRPVPGWRNVSVWFRATEDPRTYAVLRIGLVLLTFGLFAEAAEHWQFFYGEDGLYSLEDARRRLGRSALEGWSEDEGFDGLSGLLWFLWRGPSLLYFWGSSDFVVGYMVCFFLVLAAYGVGIYTRAMGVLAWLLMMGLYRRNGVYLEGTDTAFRCFWFLLLFAKTGHAFSLDNVLRCRRLQAREPIYRSVSSWPRRLLMLQLTAIYVTTGWVKHGPEWASGDALYYALNNATFYRFEGFTQSLSALFADNLFRLANFTTLWWERLFPLALLGVLLRGAALPPPLERARAWLLGRRVWLGLGAAFHLFLLLLMNLGMFAPVMLWSYLAWVPGGELVRIGSWLARRLAPYGWARGGVAVLERSFRSVEPTTAPAASHATPPAVVAGVRALAALAVAYHVVAVALTLLPGRGALHDVRDALGTEAWLRVSGTGQSWGMFSRPRRTNDTLVTTIVERAGETVTLPNHLFAEKRAVELHNDRMRKVRLRLLRERSKNYRRLWARYWCREWERRTGERPLGVALSHWSSRIPSVRAIRKRGAYDPRRLPIERKGLGRYDCKP